MSSITLGSILQENELETISSEVQKKLENFLDLKNHVVLSLEGEIQKIRADYEQKCYELDKKFIESASRLDSEATQNEKATTRCNDLEKELTELQAHCNDAEKMLHDCQKENVALNRVKDNWDEDRLALQHTIEKRDLEIARLNEEWSSVSERLREATNTKNELQLKLDEVSSTEVTSLYHTKRIEQEKDLLVQQNEQLTKDLNQKTTELLAFNKEKGSELISLRSQLDLTSDENKQLRTMVDSFKKNETAMQEKINELQEKTSKTVENYHSMEELHRNELQSQSRLAELYKQSANDAEKKSDELLSAVEELQDLVKSNAEKSDDLKQQVLQAEKKTQEHFKESERLRLELERANDLISANKRRELSYEELSEMCPTAAMTSKFIKSGMTLTQIYSQYVEQTDEVIVLKEENKRLNEAMDAILEELNAKAPLLKRQREDYERALVTINQLTQQTDEAAVDFQHIRQEADDATRRSDHLKRDNERLRKETSDLAKQVRFLLKEVEELRGREILMSPQKYGERSLLVVNDDGSCNDVSSSSELISQTLVTFKDISELQEQNQKLLGVIRKLSEDQEKAEQSGVDEKTKALQDELETAGEDLERLREDRLRQTTLIETIIRQRDMYRVLLAQNPSGGLPPSMLASPSLLVDTSMASTGSRTPTTPKSRFPIKSPDVTNAENTRKALVQLQEEYTEYKKEVLDNNKVYDKKIEDLRNELSHQKANCAKFDAQLEFSKERYNMVKNNVDSSKKEADALRAKNSQLYGMVTSHERNVSNLNAELNAAGEANAKVQAKLRTIKQELEISRRAEDRLSAENESLQREQRNQTVLLNNLQKMLQSMEEQAFEVKSQLNTRVEGQEREIKSLRQNSHNVAQTKQDEIQSVEKQLYVVQKQYDAERLKAVQLNYDLNTAKATIDSLERERDDSKAKLTAVEDRLSRAAGGHQMVGAETSSSDDRETISILREELKEKTLEVTTLEVRLDKAKQHAAHFNDVAKAAEESLKQNSDAHQELLASLQHRLEQGNQQIVTLEQRLVEVEEENSLLKNEKYKVTGEVEKQTSELRKQLTSVQSELEDAIRRRNEAVRNEQVAMEDLKQQVSKAEAACDNYQREMILHATAMQQLIQLKENAKTFESELEKERHLAFSLEESLREKTESWDSLEEKLKLETQLQKQRYSDMEEQNKILHDQIQSLSTRLVDLQSKQAVPSPAKGTQLFLSRDPVAMAVTSAESGNANESDQQLLDVIKFLRREKEIADTKSELTQSETTRLKQKLLQLQKHLSESQEKIETEQKQIQELEGKLVAMAAMKRELAIMQSTEENNRKLRSERDRLDGDLQASNSRIAQLQGDLAPLLAKNRELAAQTTALQGEKKVLQEEAERWKERVQQMTQSPRRQDPEEYRRLIQEKSSLAAEVDSLNKELTTLKSEISTVKGQVRTMEVTLQAANAASEKLNSEVKSREEEVSRCKTELEEKLQTINRIRRVGRKFKVQYEDLLKQQKDREEAEKKAEEEKPKEQEQSSGDSLKMEETATALREAEGSLAEEKARLQALSQELARSQEENKNIKAQLEEANKKLSVAGQSQSELQGENFALRSQSEERSKTLAESKKQIDDMTEKEKKFSKLLTLAKGQIEKLRKDNQEAVKERERLQEELKKIENERKSEVEQRAELQAKIEELQRQLTEGRATIHSGPIQAAERKAANIRPISAQRVNQVTPMRVTRTARVMPEPQQEAQDTDRPGPSSVAQAASSSTQVTVAASMPSVVSMSSHTTALVYPMSPARQQQQQQQQQHVGSSVAPAQAMPQPEASSETATVAESDHAIVSSSDDQTVQEEGSSAAVSTVVVSSASAVEAEASSSSAPRFVAPSSSAAANAPPANPTRPFHPSQKRTHEDAEEVNVVVQPSRSVPGSSREAQVAVAPLPKRQRPDQSSESVPLVTPSTAPVPPTRSVSSEISTGAERQPDQSLQEDMPDVGSQVEEQPQEQEEAFEVTEEGQLVVEEVSQSQQVAEVIDQSDAFTYQEVATSSVNRPEADVIVLSSDSGGENELELPDADDDRMNDDEEQDEEEMSEETDTQNGASSSTRPETQTVQPSLQPNFPTNSLPYLFLPQDSSRHRLSGRPAPLTPGIVPPPTDDGDGIVPCTPTLIQHRHDESYQAISSPRVPPGGASRFQFEDLSQAPTSFAAVPGGLASVDNTLMDLAGASDECVRNVPSIPSSSSAGFLAGNVGAEISDAQPSNSGNAAVSSSIQEEELGESEELESANPTNQEVASDAREASSIPSNTFRGRRRLRVIGAPRASRGRGGGSGPSTSNQQ